MKQADKPSTNAIQSAADRMKRGAEYNDDDLWKDDPDDSPAKPAKTDDGNHTVLRQRRRPRGRKP